MSNKNQNILDSVIARLNKSVNTIAISIESMENRSGKMTPHIKAVYPGLDGDDIKVEALDKYFSETIFCAGIEQRKDWINASQEEKQMCWANNIHPSQYKA